VLSQDIKKEIIMKKNAIIIASLSFALLTSGMFANAKPVAVHGQRCELGVSCPLPGNDSGITYFSIKPQNGLAYQCNVNVPEGKLNFYVAGGKDFHVVSGDDLYTAQPNVTINIVGNFENPTDENVEGQIKFIKILGDEGTVTCHVAS